MRLCCECDCLVLCTMRCVYTEMSVSYCTFSEAARAGMSWKPRELRRIEKRRNEEQIVKRERERERKREDETRERGGDKRGESESEDKTKQNKTKQNKTSVRVRGAGPPEEALEAGVSVGTQHAAGRRAPLGRHQQRLGHLGLGHPLHAVSRAPPSRASSRSQNFGVGDYTLA